MILSQLNSEFDNDFNIMWSGAGAGNFFIEPAKLKALDFSRVWYNWDCS
ncbi:DUF1963 domain-containing protein [Pseudoalteromonas luteoviolacea]